MTATGNALAKSETSPSAVVGQYKDDFQLVLPANFRPETFVRLAQGALRRDAKLKAAAENNPGSLLHALLDSARLGHEPGTDEYYLTVRKRKGQPEVQGIEGYKGITKRMMQHPKVIGVVAQVVYQLDQFEWSPGEMDRPLHKADWFADDRGPAIGAYAYAKLAGGSTSQVIVIGPPEIKAAEQASDARYEGRPWQKNRDAMIRKTALRRLEPFVPKASEITSQEADRSAVASTVAEKHDLPELPPTSTEPEADENGVVEGELVEDLPDAFPDEPKDPA